MSSGHLPTHLSDTPVDAMNDSANNSRFESAQPEIIEDPDSMKDESNLNMAMDSSVAENGEDSITFAGYNLPRGTNLNFSTLFSTTHHYNGATNTAAGLFLRLDSKVPQSLTDPIQREAYMLGYHTAQMFVQARVERGRLALQMLKLHQDLTKRTLDNYGVHHQVRILDEEKLEMMMQEFEDIVLNDEPALI